ncbi:hypothetical protein ACMFMF_011030 [Clarireedia jacksonii]
MTQPSTPSLRPSTSPQRGRKRRRSSAASPPPTTSSTSTNFRGRVRHRSCSRSPHKQFAGNANANGHTPQAKYQKKNINKNTTASSSPATLQVYERYAKGRRSQSPSRSRSAGQRGQEGGQIEVGRRRHRTRSRSRVHVHRRGRGGEGAEGMKG